MPLAPTTLRQRFERIAGPSGALSMVAMDQRESLRTMFVDATGGPAGDELLSDFKLAVAESLSPHASAMLLDRVYGTEAMTALASDCGLVVAADALTQDPGQPVEDTALDTDLDLERSRGLGAAALKLLVLWRPDGDPEARAQLVRSFIELCDRAELLSIVEGVVRAPAGPDQAGSWNREDAILAAAREFGALRPDLYKAEVPMHGRGDPEQIRAHCEAITAVLSCPWVVLSSGVTADDFPAAVDAACRGGASGFLAGRGIWMDLVGPGDYRSRLNEVAVPRLERLRAIVERVAVPWWERAS
jgi:sulfofructosephosphate aldolase